MSGRESRPVVRTAPEAFGGAEFIVAHCCCSCHEDGVAEFARTMRRPRSRRLSDDRRRELANHYVRFGMPVEVAAQLFRIAPKVVA